MPIKILKMKNGVRLELSEWRKGSVVVDREFSVVRGIDLLFEGRDRTAADKAFAEATRIADANRAAKILSAKR